MSKFEILAGLPFESLVLILSDDGMTGEVLQPTDTATFAIYESAGSQACVLAPVNMPIYDANNGQFELKLTADQTSPLEQYVGFQEDLYKSLSQYTGVIACTLSAGNRTVTVPVYVKKIASCS